ncbi:MAG: exonuclease domain-containing protein [Burkholderiaceae bacterium]
MTPGKERQRAGIRARFFRLFCALAVGVSASILAGLWVVARRLDTLTSTDLVNALSLGSAVSLSLSLGLLVWAWLRIDERAVQPMRALASALHTAAHTNTSEEPELPPVHELGSLGPASVAIIDALGQARLSLATARADAIVETEQQREQLAQILRDLDEPVLICTGAHKIKLCNRSAVQLLRTYGEIGLGRQLDDILSIGPLDHALLRLRGQHRSQTTTAVCGVTGSARLFHCRVALVPSAHGNAADYVLSIKDITAELTAYAAQDQLLTEMIDVAGIAVNDLDDLLDERPRADDGSARSQRNADNTLLKTAAALKSRTRAVSVARFRLLASAWPMDDIACDDIFEQVRRRVPEVALQIEDDAPWVRCDGVSIVALLASLVERLQSGAGVNQCWLVAAKRPPHVLVGVGWTGQDVAPSLFHEWLHLPLPEVPGGLNGDEILLHHQTDLSPASALEREYRHMIQFALPQSQVSQADQTDAAESSVAAPSVLMIDRPEFYDFAIDDSTVTADMLDTPLANLSYVVFDTETTGLEPLKGDEIVQIAGVRIVNSRVLTGEVFDTLVNPGRQIPASSTRIHGITDQMVLDVPGVNNALNAFRSFAADDVLVAHNAAFDMAFLRRDGREIEFDNQVLDTVLLSAFIFDHTGAHALDDLARRLGIEVDQAVRHTAIGDTLVTAQVFVKLVSLLRSQGIITLGQALAAGREMRSIRRAQARYG